MANWKTPLNLFAKLTWIPVLFLLAWSLRTIDLSELGARLTGLHPARIFVLLAINGGIFLLFTARWWIFAKGLGIQAPFVSLVRYRLTAFGITYFTPGPQVGGEPYQVLALHKFHAVPISTALSSVSLDKLLELAANFGFLLLGMGFVLISGYSARFSLILPLALFLALSVLPAIYTGLLRWRSLPLTKLVGRLAGKRPGWSLLQRATPLVADTEGQIAALCQENPLSLFLAVAIAVLTWVLMVLEYRLAVVYLGGNLSLPKVVMALSAARIAFLLPMPSGLGTLEASQVFAMQALGISPGIGLSISLLIRARDSLFGVVGLGTGGFLLPRLAALRAIFYKAIRPASPEEPVL